MSCFSVYVAIKWFKSEASTEMVLIQCYQWPDLKLFLYKSLGTF